MRLHSGSIIAGGLMAGLLLFWGGQMSCSQIRTVPETLEYRFGGEVSLTKQHEYMAITVTPKSTDAQRGAPALPTRVVVITGADFASLWSQLEKIDFTALTEPAADMFEPLPPDVSFMERLHLEVNGDTAVDWSYSGRLKDAARKPLDLFTNALMRVFKKRLETPIVPTRFTLEVIDAERGKLTLAKIGDDIVLHSGGETLPVTKRTFAAFFNEHQRAGTIFRGFEIPGPPGGPGQGEPAYALTVTMDEVTVRQVRLSEGRADRDAFARLWSELEKLGR